MLLLTCFTYTYIERNINYKNDKNANKRHDSGTIKIRNH